MTNRSNILFRRFRHAILASVVIVVFLACCQPSYGQVAKCGAPVSQQCTPNGCTQVTGWGTCVCIAVKHGRRYFLTSGHNITDGGFYICLDGWVEARVECHTETPDLALVSVQDSGQGSVYSLYSWQANKGTEVTFVGYPKYSPRSAVVRKGSILGYANPYYVDAAIRVEHGDSGGPLLVNGSVAGVVFGRSKSNGSIAMAVDSETCLAWLRSRGFDFGNHEQDGPSRPDTPPGGTPPATPDNPEAFLKLQAQISELRVLIESGAIRGPQGPPGKDGRNGVDGKQGQPGKDGRDGVDGVTPDLTAVELRLSKLESELTTMKNWKRRMLLVEDGNVIDDESYGINEPIVLDVKRFQRKSGE